MSAPPREGGSISRPPWLDGTNYPYWKVRMNAFLRAQDERVWLAVEQGWTHPTITINGVISLKRRDEWTNDELTTSGWNMKALNSIHCGVCAEEFRRISTCETAKEAWDILKITHEGTPKVRRAKLQRITLEFENLSMGENEMFGDFYAKLCEIVNNSYNLGEKIEESRVVRKILRSLPDRFQAKVTAIEESHDIDTLKVDELVGSLETHEMNFKPPSKSKSLAFKSIQEDESESEGDELNEKELISFMKKFKRFQILKKEESRRKGSSNSNERDHRHRSEKKGQSSGHRSTKGLECYECHEFGHIAPNCPKRKNRRPRNRGMNATLSDSEEESRKSENSDFDEDCTNFIAFIASHQENDETLSPRVVEGNASERASVCGSQKSHFDSDEEDDFEAIYNELFEQSLELKKTNLSLSKKLKKSEIEKSELRSKLDESIALVARLRSELDSTVKEAILEDQERVSELEKKNEELTLDVNESMRLVAKLSEIKMALGERVCVLEQAALEHQNEREGLESKIAKLKNDLENSGKLKFKSLAEGTEALNQILSFGKDPHDKSGLGYVGSKNIGTTSGTKFVPPQKPIQCSPPTSPLKKNISSFPPHTKGKPQLPMKAKTHVPHIAKSSLTYPKVKPSGFVPTCHHCGVKGHIRPRCHKLRRQSFARPYLPHPSPDRVLQKHLHALVEKSRILREDVMKLALSTSPRHRQNLSRFHDHPVCDWNVSPNEPKKRVRRGGKRVGSKIHSPEPNLKSVWVH